MWPDWVSNPGPLTYVSGALRTALRGPASKTRKEAHTHTHKEREREREREGEREKRSRKTCTANEQLFSKQVVN